MQVRTAMRNNFPGSAVLVIGGAQSGCQIAEDLIASGRRVYLSTCHVGRYPWRYRGRDTMEWLLEAGFWDQRPEDLEDQAAMRLAQPVVASGGRDLSLQMLSRSGATLLGHLASIEGGIAAFDDSTAANVAFADEFARGMRASMDSFIERSGVTAPPDADDAAGGPSRRRHRKPSTSAKRHQQCHLGHRIRRRLLLVAPARSSMTQASRFTSTARRRSRASGSPGCPGSAAATRASCMAFPSTPTALRPRSSLG